LIFIKESNSKSPKAEDCNCEFKRENTQRKLKKSTRKVMVDPNPTERNRPKQESAMKAPMSGVILLVAEDNRSTWVALAK